MGADEGEGFFFFSLQTSSFTTDKADRWKPIKTKKALLVGAANFLGSHHPFGEIAGC